MPSSVILSGTRTAIPGVYSVIKVDRSDTVELGQKKLCVVGDFPQLEPHNAIDYKVSINQQISDVIDNPANPLLDLEKLWKGAIPADLNSFGTSSSSLTFVNARITGLTQASGTLDANAALGNITSGTDIIKLSAKSWGTKGNLTSIKSVFQSINDENQIVIKITGNVDGNSATMDKRYRNVFQLKTKPATNAKVKIADGILSISLPDNTSLLSIALENYGTMGELFDVIKANCADVFNFDDIENNYVNFYGVLPKNLDCVMDAAGDNNFKEFGIATVLKFSAITQGIIDTINDAAGLPFTAQIVDQNKRIPANLYTAQAVFTPIRLLGTGVIASQGTAPDADDYEAALVECENEDFNIITCLDSSAAVGLKLAAHVDNCATISQFRNGWIGATADSSLSTIYSSWVLPINNPNISVVGQGFKWIDGDEYSNPAYLAFVMMCAQGTVPVAQPLTNLKPNIIETSQSWTRDAEATLQNAINKGIVVISNNRQLRDLRVVRSITTYLKDNLSVNCEVSARESVNQCLKDLQKFLYLQIGSTISNNTAQLVEDLTAQRLEVQRNLGFIKDFKNIAVRTVADTAFIDFDLAVTEPLNFIKITATVRQF
jgi:hypothetical protein